MTLTPFNNKDRDMTISTSSTSSTNIKLGKTNLNNSDSEQSILACIDGSSVTTSVCDYAAWYARQLGGSICLLHVINEPKSNRHDLSGAIGMDSRKHLLQDLALIDEQKARIANKHGEALLRDAKSHILEKFPDAEVRSHLRRSKLLPAIEYFNKHSRIIILGRRGEDHQNDQVNIGSHIESVVRASHRPIMVCSDDFETPDSFLLAFDGSPTAKKAVNMVCDNPVAKKLKGHILMVNHKETIHETELYKAQQQMKKAGFDITAHIIDSKKHGHQGHNNDVVAALTAFRRENQISMFIMGAYGHSKLRQFFVGSTTTKLLAKTTAPVLLLR